MAATLKGKHRGRGRPRGSNADSILSSAFRESESLASDDEKIEYVLSQYLQACFASGPLVSVMNQRAYTSPVFYKP